MSDIHDIENDPATTPEAVDAALKSVVQDTRDDSAPDGELDRLRAHNGELLAELKAARGELAELKAQVKPLQERLHQVAVHKPAFEEFVKSFQPDYWPLIERLFTERYRFQEDDSGKVRVYAADSDQPLVYQRKVIDAGSWGPLLDYLEQADKDLWGIIEPLRIKPKGGNATGSGSDYHHTPTPKQETPPAAPQAGLR